MTIATAVAVAPLAGASAAEVTGNPVDTKLQVNVAEVLTISLTTPTTWASGDLVSDGQGGFVSDLLRNKVTLEVTSNNPSGYTASMYANNTNLENQTNNSTATIPTLAENTTASAFPADRWGYSFVDNTTTAPYYAMTTGSNPISLLSYTTNSSSNVNTKDVYFGAKASAASESGTYAQTVVFSVVSGVIDPNTNPVVPTDPTGPQDTETNNPVVAYDDGTSSGTTGTAHTVYTRRTTDASAGTSTTTSEVTAGDARSNYSGVTETSYAAPQGVTTTNTNGGNPLPAILAGTAAAAAVAGSAFFVAAKRKKDDDENE